MTGPSDKELRKIRRAGVERGLAKLALACWKCRGVTLSAKEVEEIYLLDDALHTRLNNVVDAMEDAKKGSA